MNWCNTRRKKRQHDFESPCREEQFGTKSGGRSVGLFFATAFGSFQQRYHNKQFFRPYFIEQNIYILKDSDSTRKMAVGEKKNDRKTRFLSKVMLG